MATFARLIPLLALVLGPFVPEAWAQPCGGTERWAVKVGSDAAASSINTANPVPTTLNQLVFLPTPQLPANHDNDTRTAQERTVWVVEGRLVKFKPELGKTGDSDYHLVISDDTLQFSQGSTVSNHSFVAELVDPDCIPGKQGQPGTTSAFQTQIENVWEKFENRFSNPKHGWNPGNGMRVRITGVGFFDRPHGQTGRGRNQIEIHPVLDIDFLDDGSIVPSALVGNPGFESGATGWTVNNADIISTNQLEPARTGTAKAWLAGTGEPRTDRLSQRIVLPAANTVTLAFYLHISTEEQANSVFDTLTVRLLASNGSILKTLRTYSNLQARDEYQLETLNISEFAGRTVRVEFVGKEDNGSVTSFVIDDVAIIVQ